ncbi:DUF1013 domain-containing protein [Neomegalonema sp.]|uniref:DUF1013 domain-containing protein n=1 Tax=Neomegalonema sp. TaxID=2039713 RepID=UPI002639E8F8|nr:cell cycle transcriptional regulator TrcR [Neomegalonema sp.]MDD2867567.1 DUF1013 domain-containing protein [Neomegalonema sp.]
MSQVLMPKATAVWLVENTALTFEQIGDFVGMHALEIAGIADGEVAQGIKGMDPVAKGQLDADEIRRAEKDARIRLRLKKPVSAVLADARRKGPRYTPLSKRQDRPSAIAWLLRNHPELSDAQIMKLVGTTKPTIEQVRAKTHWNMANIRPVDPVALGLCSQIDLDEAVARAASRRPAALPGDGALRNLSETLAPFPEAPAVEEEEAPAEEEMPLNPDDLFRLPKTPAAGDESEAESEP